MSYNLYNRSKSNRYIPYKLLKLNQILEKVQLSITFDFIIKLLLLKELITKTIYDTIQVIIERTIRYKYFVLYKESSNIEELVYIFSKIIIVQYRLLEEIIIDRDKLFISKFWTILITQIRTNHKLLIIFYLQTNRITERLNQILE